MKKFSYGVGGVALAALLAASESDFAGDATAQVTQAVLHANYAATALNVKEVHEHLHHVINCLVGPKGAGFDTKEMNPCHGMGNGAIPDTLWNTPTPAWRRTIISWPRMRRARPR